MSDGIPIPGWRNAPWMNLVHPHAAYFVIFVIEDGDLLGLLQDLYCRGRKNEGQPSGPTLVARSRIADTGQRDFAVLLHDRRRLGLQDRIVVVADKLPIVARDAAPRQVSQRRRARGNGLVTGDGCMSPHAGEIRDRCGAVRAPAGWRCRLPQGGCRRRYQCRQEEDVLSPHSHALLPLIALPVFSEILYTLLIAVVATEGIHSVLVCRPWTPLATGNSECARAMYALARVMAFSDGERVF